MAVNSFSVLDGEMNTVGTGIYLAASVLDHNCQPNAVATFDGRTLNLRIIVDMPHLNWDSIFISYIDIMDDTETRRKSLKKNYYFLCGCSCCVCHSQDELNMYPALCPECANCYCISQKKCSSGGKCKYVLSPEFKAEYDEVAELSRIKLAEMSNTACKSNAPSSLLSPFNTIASSQIWTWPKCA